MLFNYRFLSFWDIEYTSVIFFFLKLLNIFCLIEIAHIFSLYILSLMHKTTLYILSLMYIYIVSLMW